MKASGPSRGGPGFTLIELMVVMIALGLIASVVIPQFTTATQDAMAGSLKSQLRSLQNQIEMYVSRNSGAYPVTATTPDWSLLKAAGFIKADPVNPAFTGANKPGVTVHATARGSAGHGWVWNTGDRTLYASNFDESTGLVTQNATD
ncbi:MAG: prepilin-type N-terminal cleavage/methylation domain-containing protein [Phycisphaerae bacterium]